MRNGFTLIELVIVSAVIMFLTGGVISNFQGFNDREKVNQAMANLKQNLRVAQTKALSGEKPAGCTTLVGYKITFTGTNYSMQAVCNNGAGNVDVGPITSVTFPNGVSFPPAAVPSPITFGVVSKGATNPQMITLTGASVTTQIVVSSSGLISDVLPTSAVSPTSNPSATPTVTIAPTPTPVPTPTFTPTLSTTTFSYTGGQQSWVVPAGVTSITVDARGARGGVGDSAQGTAGGLGLGGRVVTTISVTVGETLYINVGGAGGKPGGGFNGGGTGGGTAVNSFKAGGGGGPSDVRRGGSALANRVVIAAGGGGGACGGDRSEDIGGSGGAGGGTNGVAGGNGTGCCDTAGGGKGASQTSGGVGGAASGDSRSLSGGAGGIGFGGNGASSGEDVGCGAGGGGGYYGGGGGASSGGAGGGGAGGGSSWTSGTNTTYATGYQAGNGSIAITY